MDRNGQIGAAAAAMRRYIEQKETFRTGSVKRVPTRSYTDPDQWKAEIELVFRRLPLMLALTAEMPLPGDYKAMDVMGLPVLINRDKAGKVHAFLNVCPHRGAPVASEGHGNCPRFTCRYHGWTFGQDGQLIGVSEASKFGTVDKAELGLRELPSAERAGMIFVSLTPEAPMDIDRFTRGFLADFEGLGLAQWTWLGSRVIEGANWKVAIDGYLESYHFASLHPETIHPRTASNRAHYEAFGPHQRIGFPQHRIGAVLDAIAPDQWGLQENNGFDFARVLFPNVSVFVAPEITQIAQIFPGPTPDRNRTVLNYLRREPIRDEADRAATEAAMNFFRDVTYTEDYLIGMDVQKGLSSGAHDEILFGRNEPGNQYFHEWLDWYLQDDTDMPEPELRARD